jgi:hypothetical protein
MKLRTIVGIALIATLAHAQGASHAAAEALFNDAKRLLAAGQVHEACTKFAESQRLDPGAGTLLNLAACYEKEGRVASAWATYVEAQSLADKTGRAAWAQSAKKKAAELGTLVPKITITVLGATPDLRVERDGALVPVAQFGSAIPVDPGKVRVAATAPKFKAWEKTLDVRAGESVSVAIPALVPEPAQATTATATEPPTAPTTTTAPLPDKRDTGGSSSLKTVGYIAIGVGGAGLLAGGIFGVLANGQKNDAVENYCRDGGARCTQAGMDGLNGARSKATLSTIAMIAGGAILATGVVLLLVAPSKKESVARWVRDGGQWTW